MNKTKKKGGAAVAAPMGVGLLAGHTLAKKQEKENLGLVTCWVVILI